MEASQEQMRDAKLPIAYRDACGAFLIPLNECRRATWSAPWKCNDERHIYEKCQYLEYQRRVAALKDEQKSL
jgi:hypothetical protein